MSQKIHPQTIINGWRKATDEARRALEASAADNSVNAAQFREDLMNISRTTLSSKILQQNNDHFSLLAVDAVLRLKVIISCVYLNNNFLKLRINKQGSGNLDAIQIIKKLGGNLSDSYLDEGFLLDKKIGVNQPKRVENAKILIANTSMDTDKIKVFGSRVKVDSVSKVADLEMAEKEKMKEKVEKIVKHGCNVFINRFVFFLFDLISTPQKLS